MASHWTEEEDKKLSELVVRLRFNFSKISKELNRDEEAVRTHWTELYLSKKQAKEVKKPPAPKPAYIENQSPPKRLECPRISFEQRESTVLDTSNVDFTQQTSKSITGEVIHPSGFNIFKHSLKEVFTEMIQRMQTFIPAMDFAPAEAVEDIEPVSYKITFRSGKPTIETKTGAKGAWRETEPSAPVPNYDDINPIPERDRPVRKPHVQVPMLDDSDEVLFRAVDSDLTEEYQKTTKELAKLFNVPESDVRSLKQGKAPTRLDTIKGRVRAEATHDSDYESDEEEAFLRAERMSKKQVSAPRKPQAVAKPPTPPQSDSDKEEEGEQEEEEESVEDTESSVLGLPEPYSVQRQKILEDRAEAYRQLRIIEAREREERAVAARKEQQRREQEELERKIREDEEENARLQAKREAKIQAMIVEELKRKEQLLQAEAEVKKKLEEEQRKKTEARIKSLGFCFFDASTSFEPPLPTLPPASRVRIIAIQDEPYTWRLITHFLGHSAVFGKSDPDDIISFRLVGLTRTVLGGTLEDLTFAHGTESISIWFLAFDLDSSSIGFNAFLEGFPLAYVIPGGIPGKTFLKEIALDVEHISDRHMVLPVESVFQAAPSFYPKNDSGLPEYEYAFAVIKPHSSPSASVAMLQSLSDQLSAKGLDIVGCRLLHPGASALQAYESRFGKGLSALSAPFLALCIYGYSAIDQLHELLGAETPDLARRTDPASLRAAFGESKDRNCVYTAKLKQRVYKEMCVWFGGRADISPTATVLECPVTETVCIAFSPESSCSQVIDMLEKTMKLGYLLVNIERLSKSGTATCGFQPTVRTLYKTQITAANGWLLTVKRPGAQRHLAQLLELLGLEERCYKVLTSEEAQSLEPARSNYGDLEIFASAAHILLTPEAFVQTAGSFPAFRIAEKVAEQCEIVSLKVVSTLPAEVDSDYIDTVQQRGQDLRPWLCAGPLFLVSYLPETPEAKKALISALRKEVPNPPYSQFTKPCYILANRSGPGIAAAEEMVFDALCPVTALVNFPPGIEDPAVDRTLATVCVVKPEKGQTVLRQVLKFAWRHEFTVQRVQMQRLTEGLADLLYDHQKEGMSDDFDYEAFKSQLLSGPCVTILLTRQNAIKRLKTAVGHADPRKAELNSLRGSFGKSPEDNKLHCSLSYAHAQTEALRLFAGDEFVSAGIECSEDTAVGVIALSRLDEKDTVSAVLEEVKSMQLALIDLRISRLPDSHISTYSSFYPEDSEFCGFLQEGKCLALALRGLVAAYRLQTMHRTLKLEQYARCPTAQDDADKFCEIFLPAYPY